MRYIERYHPKEGDGHNKILVITGVPAVGKDYLLSESKRLGMIPPSVRSFSFGEELFVYLQTLYPQVKTRDDIRTLLSQDVIRAAVEGIIFRMIQAQPSMLNTHVVYRQKDSIVTNPDLDKRIHPHSYLFVWSEPDQIAKWRSLDTSRTRPAESVTNIALHQDIALEVVSVVARHTGASLKTVWNRADNTQENLVLIQEKVHEIIL